MRACAEHERGFWWTGSCEFLLQDMKKYKKTVIISTEVNALTFGSKHRHKCNWPIHQEQSVFLAIVTAMKEDNLVNQLNAMRVQQNK